MELRVAADRFLYLCAIERQLSAHTQEAYACDLADLQRSLSPSIELSDISTEAIKQYLEELVQRRRLAAATVRRRSRAFEYSSAGSWTPARWRIRFWAGDFSCLVENGYPARYLVLRFRACCPRCRTEGLGKATI